VRPCIGLTEYYFINNQYCRYQMNQVPLSSMVDGLQRDFKHATRALLFRKTYSSVSIVTLALVVGAATAVIAVINATMIRPLPFPHDDRLAQVFLMPPGAKTFDDRNPFNNRAFLRFRTSLQQVEKFEGLWARERALGTGTEPESVTTAAVSAGALDLFGGAPMLGRVFTEDEARIDARVAVLSHGLWQRRFGADARVIGQTIQIDREPFEVIGVMPAPFRPGYVASDLWTPLNITEANLTSGSTFIQTFARLRPGVTLPQLGAELEQAMQRVAAESPNTHSGWTTMAMTLREAQFGRQRAALWVLLAAVLTLAVIACANLSNLTLAQVMARRLDFALRAAIGGRSADIVRLQLIETLVLTSIGVAGGLVLGSWMLPALLALDPTTAQTLRDVEIDWRIQSAIAALASIIAILSALLPLSRVLGGRNLIVVSGSSRRAIGSRADQRLRHALVGVQTAMAVVLMICGALLLSGLNRASQIDPGFDPSNILGAQMRISAIAYPTEPARAALIRQVIERIRAVPGVSAAAATLNPFIPNFFFQTTVAIDGKPTPDGQPHTVQFRRATPQYFKTMRIPVLRGRDFADGDATTSPNVAIVSESFADRFWPGEDAIGRTLKRGTRQVSVIGIVADVRDVNIGKPPGPTIYVSYLQNNVALTPVSLVIRTSGDPIALTNAVRAAVLSVDPLQPIDHVTTVEQFLGDSLGPQKFRSALLLVLSIIGVAIAAVGIYGVTSRAVQERTQELGVRLALGATHGSVVRTVVWQTLRSVVAGLAAGAALAGFAATVLLRALPDLSGGDAWTAAPAVLVLAMTATFAAAIPARHAAALDPVIALRAE
jgi:putative ABC transport system permease protein